MTRSPSSLPGGFTGPLLVVTDARRREGYWSALWGGRRGTAAARRRPGARPSRRPPAAVPGYAGTSGWTATSLRGPARDDRRARCSRHRPAVRRRDPLYLRSPDVTLLRRPEAGDRSDRQLRRASAADLAGIMLLETRHLRQDAGPAAPMRPELATSRATTLWPSTSTAPTWIEGYAGLLAPSGAGEADIQTIAVAEIAGATDSAPRCCARFCRGGRRGPARSSWRCGPTTRAQRLYRRSGSSEIAVRPRLLPAGRRRRARDAPPGRARNDRPPPIAAPGPGRTARSRRAARAGHRDVLRRDRRGHRARRELLADAIASAMDEHARYGGVVPEVAARAHLEALTPSWSGAARGRDRARRRGRHRGDQRPGAVRRADGRRRAAKALALASGKPLYAVNHLVGHVGADVLDARRRCSSTRDRAAGVRRAHVAAARAGPGVAMWNCSARP